jgi:hypothetical protein
MDAELEFDFIFGNFKAEVSAFILFYDSIRFEGFLDEFP